jgi:hypothetical protein
VNAHNCQAPHTMYTISGSKKVVMEDGTEDETRPADSALAYIKIPYSVLCLQGTFLPD